MADRPLILIDPLPRTLDVICEPDVRKRLSDLGMEIVGGSAEDATTYVMRQAERVKGLIKAGVLTPE